MKEALHVHKEPAYVKRKHGNFRNVNKLDIMQYNLMYCALLLNCNGTKLCYIRHSINSWFYFHIILPEHYVLCEHTARIDQ